MNIVYSLSSTSDNRVRYIGQTKKTAQERRDEHIKEAINSEPLVNSSKCLWIRYQLSRGHQIQIAILKENTTWDIDERAFIQQYISMGADLVNDTDGGCGGSKVSNAAKIRMSFAAKNKPPVSEETREKLRKIHTGRVFSLESRAKISAAIKGKPKSEETKKKISNTLKGSKLSEEVKAKCRIGQRARWAKRKAAWIAAGRPGDVRTFSLPKEISSHELCGGEIPLLAQSTNY
jgi:hypothetical protein